MSRPFPKGREGCCLGLGAYVTRITRTYGRHSARPDIRMDHYNEKTHEKWASFLPPSGLARRLMCLTRHTPSHQQSVQQYTVYLSCVRTRDTLQHAARTSEPCTNRLTPGPARLERIYPRRHNQGPSFTHSREIQRENHVTGEMLSLRANCRFQVRAVVDLSLPALGE